MFSKFKNLIFYFFSYFSLIKPKFKLNKQIDFGSKKSNNYFLNKLKNINYYFEIGSGASTLLALKENKKFLSIESSKPFYNFIKNKIGENIYYSDLGPTKYYSYPILPCFLIKKKIQNYANTILIYYYRFSKFPELILIDGRFRVYCVLNILEIMKNYNSKKKSIIIIDDFKSRTAYFKINEVIKVRKVGRFGIIYINEKVLKKIKLSSINSLKKKVYYEKI
jgi:hypothetical protein